MPLLAERCNGARILELGCGSGQDTATLVAAGHCVTGIDLSVERVAKARVRVPSAEFHCRDIQEPFPLTAAGAVVASLSLHYFAWPETLSLAARIRIALRQGGVLLCRLNSTNDHNYGASGHPAIEENYYLVDSEPKRFFDRAAVERLFATGWRTVNLEEMTIHRYGRPKAVWEAVLEPA